MKYIIFISLFATICAQTCNVDRPNTCPFNKYKEGLQQVCDCPGQSRDYQECQNPGGVPPSDWSGSKCPQDTICMQLKQDYDTFTYNYVVCVKTNSSNTNTTKTYSISTSTSKNVRPTETQYSSTTEPWPLDPITTNNPFIPTTTSFNPYSDPLENFGYIPNKEIHRIFTVLLTFFFINMIFF